MNKRTMGYEKYGISKKRYKELSGFCEQYPEWKKELEMKDSTLKSPQLTGMPVTHSNADVTGELAVRRATLEEKCRLIEDTAKEASEELKSYIIKSVCYELTFPQLQLSEGIPCGHAAFYDARKYFFYLLNKKR